MDVKCNYGERSELSEENGKDSILLESIYDIMNKNFERNKNVKAAFGGVSNENKNMLLEIGR